MIAVAAIAGLARDAVAAERDVRDYRPVFQACGDKSGAVRLAIRRMTLDGKDSALLVDPQTLATSLGPVATLSCVDTVEAAYAETRYVRAIQTPVASAAASPAHGYLRNAGVTRGEGQGSFITGDLCPSGKPLDRAFFEELKRLGPGTPVALSISGLWLTHHRADFQWLREQARDGALEITWVNHSYRHPYSPSRPLESNFLLEPGVDMTFEVFETEQLLIAEGETPSAFFRFPGLISSAALMETLRADHLVVLGASGWLAVNPEVKQGGVILVHPNGNEPLGLKRFSTMLDSNALPRPFHRIADAP